MERTHKIENGDIVRHFKGGTYEVIDTNAVNTIGGRRVVVYKGQSDNKIYVRPYDEFMGTVCPINYPELTDTEFRFIVIRKARDKATIDYESMYKDLEEKCVKFHCENEELKQCIKHLALSINAVIK